MAFTFTKTNLSRMLGKRSIRVERVTTHKIVISVNPKPIKITEKEMESYVELINQSTGAPFLKEALSIETMYYTPMQLEYNI